MPGPFSRSQHRLLVLKQDSGTLELTPRPSASFSLRVLMLRVLLLMLWYYVEVLGTRPEMLEICFVSLLSWLTLAIITWDLLFCLICGGDKRKIQFEWLSTTSGQCGRELDVHYVIQCKH